MAFPKDAYGRSCPEIERKAKTLSAACQCEQGGGCCVQSLSPAPAPPLESGRKQGREKN